MHIGECINTTLSVSLYPFYLFLFHRFNRHWKQEQLVLVVLPHQALLDQVIIAHMCEHWLTINMYNTVYAFVSIPPVRPPMMRPAFVPHILQRPSKMKTHFHGFICFFGWRTLYWIVKWWMRNWLLFSDQYSAMVVWVFLLDSRLREAVMRAWIHEMVLQVVRGCSWCVHLQ